MKVALPPLPVAVHVHVEGNPTLRMMLYREDGVPKMAVCHGLEDCGPAIDAFKVKGPCDRCYKCPSLTMTLKEIFAAMNRGDA